MMIVTGGRATVILVPSEVTHPLRQTLLRTSQDNVPVRSLEAQVSAYFVNEGTPVDCNEDLIQPVVFVRPYGNEAGLYAFVVTINNEEASSRPNRIKQGGFENVRATRMAMACGLFGIRLYGPVVLVRLTRGGMIHPLDLSEVEMACCISPDLRLSYLEQIQHDDMEIYNNIPDWLANAAQQNYHYKAAVEHLAKVMSIESEPDVEKTQVTSEFSIPTLTEARDAPQPAQEDRFTTCQVGLSIVTRTPLCLHCRRPCSALCPKCQGAYFCEAPRQCSYQGWSHECLCTTWKAYVDRRSELSTFEGLGDWYKELVARVFQVSDGPYQDALCSWGITNEQSSWWRTETDGWMGGSSAGAQAVDVFNRLSYSEGFFPIQEIPPERPANNEEIELVGPVVKNSLGMLVFSSWKEYYILRRIPASSPVALLLSFPLTLYHAIAVYGEAPATVASMLRRPIRIHLVGVEKELNFLDLFKEVGFLLPQDVQVELVFVVREDMIPKNAGSLNEHASGMRLQLTTNLTLIIVVGTYGDSLDPNFDCGSGPPDMVMGMNAGIFAYDSWRSVVTYLYHALNVVGVFTDYNEHSGMNCASLGGRNCRQSLVVNPFRQPRAMPVYSMNLPQFSNGFYYVFNEQLIE